MIPRKFKDVPVGEHFSDFEMLYKKRSTRTAVPIMRTCYDGKRWHLQCLHAPQWRYFKGRDDVNQMHTWWVQMGAYGKPMDVELKARWVGALRSGEYQQCFAGLWARTPDGPRFCALGVLTEVLGLNNEKNSTHIYPSDWLEEAQIDKIINLNDQLRLSFAQIADWIEENL